MRKNIFCENKKKIKFYNLSTKEFLSKKPTDNFIKKMTTKIPQNLPILSITEPEIYDNTSDIPSSLRDRMESVDFDFFDIASKAPQNFFKSEFHSSVGNMSPKAVNEEPEPGFTQDNESFNFQNIFQKPFVVR